MYREVLLAVRSLSKPHLFKSGGRKSCRFRNRMLATETVLAGYRIRLGGGGVKIMHFHTYIKYM